MSAKTKTEREMKQWFLRAEKRASTGTNLLTQMSYAILADIDAVMINAWSVMSDMGYSKADYDKIKRLVKKRL
jgi:hypothetical protein